MEVTTQDTANRVYFLQKTGQFEVYHETLSLWRKDSQNIFCSNSRILKSESHTCQRISVCLRCTRMNSCLEKSLLSANRKPQWVPCLPFAQALGPADLSRQLGHIREKGQSWDVATYVFLYGSYGAEKSLFSTDFLCTRGAAPSQELGVLWKHTTHYCRSTVWKWLVLPSSYWDWSRVHCRFDAKIPS